MKRTTLSSLQEQQRPDMIASILRFDYETLCLGRLLTDQQLWCLGCDVRSSHCSLKRLGWHYHTRPDKSKGCGRLIGKLPMGGQLSMWGFGFMANDSTHGALWLDRKGFRPRRNPMVDPKLPIFGINDLPPFRTPETTDHAHALLFLLGQLAKRMEQHEHDILSFSGSNYRQHCLRQWKFQRSALAPDDVPAAWGKIAQSVKEMRQPTNALLEENVA